LNELEAAAAVIAKESPRGGSFQLLGQRSVRKIVPIDDSLEPVVEIQKTNADEKQADTQQSISDVTTVSPIVDSTPSNTEVPSNVSPRVVSDGITYEIAAAEPLFPSVVEPTITGTETINKEPSKPSLINTELSTSANDVVTPSNVQVFGSSSFKVLPTITSENVSSKNDSTTDLPPQ